MITFKLVRPLLSQRWISLMQAIFISQPVCLITCPINGPVYYDVMQLIIVNSVHND